MRRFREGEGMGDPEGTLVAGLSALLPPEAIRLGVRAGDWREAVRAAGAVFEAIGATTADYTREMVATVERLGPYIVIAPGIALAHGRPSPAVRRTALCWVGLAEPVAFGHPQNDPVTLVVGLSAPDDSSHVKALATLAELLADDDRREALMRAPDAEAIRRVISEYEVVMEENEAG